MVKGYKSSVVKCVSGIYVLPIISKHGNIGMTQVCQHYAHILLEKFKFHIHYESDLTILTY